ncbi:hypothetical protein AC249_AIPGENE7365 [Exaiptasia diaphana]|nr:hypothetical protein AC249_AIPGENE7365 [Exaiptasia diaphana]
MKATTIAKREVDHKTFGTGKDESGSNTEKRIKLTEQLRQKKSSEICEDIETVTKVMTCLENERVKLVNMQKYSQAGAVLQQISEKRKEKRQLSDRLSKLQEKEARSKSYYRNKEAGASKRKSAANPNTLESNPKTLEGFFRSDKDQKRKQLQQSAVVCDLTNLSPLKPKEEQVDENTFKV